HPSQQGHEPFYANDATLPITTNREEPDMHSPSVLPESAPPDFETTHSAQSRSVRPGPAQPGPDTGWGIVLRHDLDSPAPEVWRRLLADWLPLWLGVDSVPQMVGAPLRREGRGR